ncbi:MAG: Smr/MutS family protein [Gammaproteobacteria bacterium]
MSRDPDDDSGLFRAAVKDVKPLKPGGRRPPEPRRPAPRPLQHEADEREALRESREGPLPDVGDELLYRGAGIQDAVFRRLRRGTYRVGAVLDLHGLRWDEARPEMTRFLAASRDAGARCVRIIHGKGLRSKGDGPVLKQRLDGWLRQRSEVLAFCSARREDGGTGAVYVLLREMGSG